MMRPTDATPQKGEPQMVHITSRLYVLAALGAFLAFAGCGAVRESRPPATPTLSGTIPQGFKLVSDLSQEYEYPSQPTDTWIAFSCAPESDPHGSLAVRVYGGTNPADNPVDFGLVPCNGVTHMEAIAGDNNWVMLCEDSDFGTPALPDTGTTGCREGAVRWTLITPVQVQSGPFGWG